MAGRMPPGFPGFGAPPAPRTDEEIGAEIKKDAKEAHEKVSRMRGDWVTWDNKAVPAPPLPPSTYLPNLTEPPVGAVNAKLQELKDEFKAGMDDAILIHGAAPALLTAAQQAPIQGAYDALMRAITTHTNTEIEKLKNGHGFSKESWDQGFQAHLPPLPASLIQQQLAAFNAAVAGAVIPAAAAALPFLNNVQAQIKEVQTTALQAELEAMNKTLEKQIGNNVSKIAKAKYEAILQPPHLAAPDKLQGWIPYVATDPEVQDKLKIEREKIALAAGGAVLPAAAPVAGAGGAAAPAAAGAGGAAAPVGGAPAAAAAMPVIMAQASAAPLQELSIRAGVTYHMPGSAFFVELKEVGGKIRIDSFESGPEKKLPEMYRLKEGREDERKKKKKDLFDEVEKRPEFKDPRSFGAMIKEKMKIASVARLEDITMEYPNLDHRPDLFSKYHVKNMQIAIMEALKNAEKPGTAIGFDLGPQARNALMRAGSDIIKPAVRAKMLLDLDTIRDKVKDHKEKAALQAMVAPAAAVVVPPIAPPIAPVVAAAAPPIAPAAAAAAAAHKLAIKNRIAAVVNRSRPGTVDPLADSFRTVLDAGIAELQRTIQVENGRQRALEDNGHAITPPSIDVGQALDFIRELQQGVNILPPTTPVAKARREAILTGLEPIVDDLKAARAVNVQAIGAQRLV